MAEVCEAIQTFKGTGKFDAKGREIGFAVGFSDDGVNFYAWVQASRRVGGIQGDFHDFGVRQRSKRFDSQKAASTWAWRTANERIAKLA